MYAGHIDNSGYISNFDFNISGSIHDKVFLGFRREGRKIQKHELL